MSEPMDGYKKAALLLYSIGEEAATEIMSRLDPSLVQKIGKSIAEIKKFDKEAANKVLGEFHREVSDVASMGKGSQDYVRSVMTRMLGPARAKAVISRILNSEENEGFRDLKWMDAQSIASLLGEEHPQIISVILAHLDTDQSAQILTMLPNLVRDDVILRIALLEDVNPVALEDINDALSRIVKGPVTDKSNVRGGVRLAAEMLGKLPTGEDQKMIDRIKAIDGDLAQKILDEMFVFDDIMGVDDAGMRNLLRDLEQKTLIVALKGAKQEIRDKIFKNMSSRQTEMIQDEMSSMPPMRLADVEAAQKEVVKMVLEKAEKGEIVLAGKGEEML